MASGDLALMEDPHQSIDALQRFLESTVARALDGLTLDALYALTGEPPEVPNWIGKSAARLQAVSREEPYRVRLAQVPATAGDARDDQILHHIQTATRSDDGNRLQLVELTYAFCADEVPAGPTRAAWSACWPPSSCTSRTLAGDSHRRSARDRGRRPAVPGPLGWPGDDLLRSSGEVTVS